MHTAHLGLDVRLGRLRLFQLLNERLHRAKVLFPAARSFEFLLGWVEADRTHHSAEVFERDLAYVRGEKEAGIAGQATSARERASQESRVLTRE
eukprot:COSAG02_NODE_1496_length_12308_cov_6.264313_1_plen_94_part_00